MFRLISGFVITALWLPVLSLFTSGIYGNFWFWMIACYTVPLTIFVAVPLYYAMRRKINFLFCIVSGIGIGALGSLLFLAMTNWLSFLKWSPLLIFVGLVSSLLFWFVAVWKNSGLTRSSTGRTQTTARAG
jgi:hypothetical protein